MKCLGRTWFGREERAVMTRMTSRFRVDPWIYLIFTSAGLAPWIACGGTAASDGSPRQDGLVDGGGGASARDNAEPLAFGVCDELEPAGGGWIHCAQGFTHRAQVEGQCETMLPRNEVSGPAAPGPTTAPCSTDAECSSLLYGHC